MARLTWENAVAAKLDGGNSQSGYAANTMRTSGFKGIGTALRNFQEERDGREAIMLTTAADKIALQVAQGSYDVDQGRRTIIDQIKDPKMQAAALASFGNIPPELMAANAEGSTRAASYGNQREIENGIQAYESEMNNRVNSNKLLRIYTQAVAAGGATGSTNPMERMYEKLKTEGGADIENSIRAVNVMFKEMSKELQVNGKDVIPPEVIAEALMNESVGSWWLNPLTGDGRQLSKKAAMDVISPLKDPAERNRLETQRQRYDTEKQQIASLRATKEMYVSRLGLAETRGNKDEVARIQKNLDMLGDNVVKFRDSTPERQAILAKEQLAKVKAAEEAVPYSTGKLASETPAAKAMRETKKAENDAYMLQNQVYNANQSRNAANARFQEQMDRAHTAGMNTSGMINPQKFADDKALREAQGVPSQQSRVRDVFEPAIPLPDKGIVPNILDVFNGKSPTTISNELMLDLRNLGVPDPNAFSAGWPDNLSFANDPVNLSANIAPSVGGEYPNRHSWDAKGFMTGERIDPPAYAIPKNMRRPQLDLQILTDILQQFEDVPETVALGYGYKP